MQFEQLFRILKISLWYITIMNIFTNRTHISSSIFLIPSCVNHLNPPKGRYWIIPQRYWLFASRYIYTYIYMLWYIHYDIYNMYNIYIYVHINIYIYIYIYIYLKITLVIFRLFTNLPRTNLNKIEQKV